MIAIRQRHPYRFPSYRRYLELQFMKQQIVKTIYLGETIKGFLQSYTETNVLVILNDKAMPLELVLDLDTPLNEKSIFREQEIDAIVEKALIELYELKTFIEDSSNSHAVISKYNERILEVEKGMISNIDMNIITHKLRTSSQLTDIEKSNLCYLVTNANKSYNEYRLMLIRELFSNGRRFFNSKLFDQFIHFSKD